MSFFIVITKREKYITIIIKRRRGGGGGELRNITTGKQTITTQHKYLLTARNEWYKKLKQRKKNKRIRQKENQRNWHL